MTTLRIILAAAMVFAISPVAWTQEYQTTGKILKIDQAGGKITLQHQQGGTTVGTTADAKLLVDEYQLGKGLPVTDFKPGDQVSYTETRLDGVWTVTRMQKQ